VGEIHLDEFSTDIHKTDFLRDDPTFSEMQDELVTNVLSNLIEKVTKLTNREVFNKYQFDMNVVSKTLNRVVRSYDFLRNIDLDEGVLDLLKKKIRRERIKVAEKNVDDSVLTIEQLDEFLDMVESKERETDETQSEDEQTPKKKRERKINPNIGLIIEEPVPVSLGEEHPPKRWIVFDKEDGTHLQIDINLDHPIYHKEEEVAVIVRNIVLESVAEFIFKEEKKKSDIIEDEIERLNRIKDMLVRHSFKAG
jgi:hypothetical protein